MDIRKATFNDLQQILDIYAFAREFMASNNNPTQWGTTYPSLEQVTHDITNKELYVAHVGNEIAGVFMLLEKPEPDYTTIIGNWLNDEPYVTIHRVATIGKHKGVLTTCINYAKTLSDNVRVDTHENNFIVQKVALANDFTYCGTVFIKSGDSRRAYHWCDKQQLDK
ncbi:MAG: GNAT family N-acetyltransferase [Eubacteriales bacterium]